MEYATLGNTGLLVSKLCFGTMTFGDGRGLFKAISPVDQAGVDELVKTSIDGGINFFDTTNNYIQSAITSAARREKTHHICKEKPMPELSHIDPGSAALLVMDYQVDNLTRFMTAAQSADAIACVPDLIATARDAGMMVIHVVVAFRSGHPEVSPRNPDFSAVKANGMLVAGSEGAAIHPAAAAREGEPIVVKHRVSPFVGTDLETLLRASGIDTLVLAGVRTSGVVLSTVRQAVDLDYGLVVVRDCCADPDAEVHAMLLDIVIAKQAVVVTTAELAGALPGRSS